MAFGLSDEVIVKIKEVFAAYPDIDEAVIYGSRAKGNPRPGSDIDLTLKGPGLNLQTLNKIGRDLDDLLLPYTFDLSIHRQISNQDLLNHIERVGYIFYQTQKDQ